MLVVALLLIFVLAYKFSFARTFEQNRKITLLENDITINSSIAEKLISIKQREKNVIMLLKGSAVEGVSIQNQLLKVLTNPNFRNTKNYQLIDFKTPHEYLDKETNTVIITYNFKLQGSYNTLLNVLYNLEQKQSLGNIISVNFLKEKDFSRRRDYLTCEVLLQRFMGLE